jgi:hypothetical protein
MVFLPSLSESYEVNCFAGDVVSTSAGGLVVLLLLVCRGNLAYSNLCRVCFSLF